MALIGIYGGAFDPPHREHVGIVKNLLAERKYDRFIIVPSDNAPHKTTVTPFAHRAAMLAIALDGVDNVVIDLREGRDERVHYSAETVAELAREYGGCDMEFVIGSDSMRDLRKWRTPEKIFDYASVTVVPRGAVDEAAAAEARRYIDECGARITFTDYIAESVSSSRLRLALELHDDVRGLVDDGVIEYIESHSLYNNYADLLGKLRDGMSESRYAHTLNVCRFAVEINECLRIDHGKVVTAALLHDCAKEGVYGYPIPEDARGTPVAHCFNGAYLARERYGVTDGDVLDAIRYHATGRANMSTLEKLIFSADMAEYGRDFDGAEGLRELLLTDFEKGFEACLKATYEHVIATAEYVYPLTYQAYGYYIENKG